MQLHSLQMLFTVEEDVIIMKHKSAASGCVDKDNATRREGVPATASVSAGPQTSGPRAIPPVDIFGERTLPCLDNCAACRFHFACTSDDGIVD